MFEVRKNETRLTEGEYKRFHRGDLIFGEYTPKVIASFETEDEAKAYLNGVRCTYEHASAGNDWLITEYGFYDEDYPCLYLAEEREHEYVLYDDERQERYRTSDFDDAKEMADKIYDETEDVVEIRKEYV